MNAYDLAVIGAGPAGLSAALTAAQAGAKVVVVDENPVPGGKLLGQLHQESSGSWWVGKNTASDLVQQARAAGVTLMTNRKVWALSPGWKLALNGSQSILAAQIVIATGAAERAIPIPGWTIPGVMAIGAAQTLTNYYRVRPGERIAVVGVDPLSLTVAQELAMAGAEVIGIFLPPTGPFSKERADPRQVLRYLSTLAHLAPNPLLQAGGRLMKTSVLQGLAAKFYPRHGVSMLGTKLRLRQSITAIYGRERVHGIRVTDVDHQGRPTTRSTTLDVDCVCISGGLYPVQELTTGCEIVRIDELGGQVPLYSLELETTRKNLFVAGNVMGIEGAKVAMAQGTLAGCAVAVRLGLLDETAIQRASQKVGEAREASAITFEPEIHAGRRQAEELWRLRAAAARDQEQENA